MSVPRHYDALDTLDAPVPFFVIHGSAGHVYNGTVEPNWTLEGGTPFQGKGLR